MKKVWLIGSGEMSQEYIKVLDSLNVTTTIIGRGENSANKLIDAAKAAEVKRGKSAVAGDKEGAKKALGQGKKFYDAAKAKRMKESTDRMKERMSQLTRDHDNILSGKQPI